MSGFGVIPGIVTPALEVKEKWFKSSLLSPVEGDPADGTKRSGGVGGVIRGDGSVFTSKTIMEDEQLSQP